MNHSIYNLYPTITLLSGNKIYLQSISFSHTYSGLLCGSPTEVINEDILLDIREEFQEEIYVVEPDITWISENEFLGRCTLDQNNLKQVPLLPSVKVHALFECHENESSTYLNIIWFQDDISIIKKSAIEERIKNIDWYQYACEFSI